MHLIPKRSRVLWLVLAILTCLTSLAYADTIDRPHKQNEILIKFKDTATPAQINAIMDDLGAVRLKHMKRIKTDHDAITKVNAGEAIGRYKNHPAIEFIEPNYILHAVDLPNDARFDELWGMQNTGQTGGTAGADISATSAWDVFGGSHNVVVGVIDTGVDYNHPDLAGNIWTNPGEIAGNGIDDDNNGYIDDIHGWDFANNDNDPMDDNGHGTHCSGTIGASGNNNIGVIGVSPEVSIMALKFLTGSGSGSTANALLCIEYATMMGADLTSNSWGGGGFSESMHQAIADAAAANVLFVAAAGNDGQDNDSSPHYPSNYDLDNIVAVAATDHNDEMASFSDWGLTTVDIAAPGVNILSTQPGGAYGSLSGTSMATPHVSGALALIKGRFPAIGAEDAKALLMNMADPLANLDGLMVSGSRLNAFMAIADPDSIAPGQITDLAAGTAGSNWLEVSWSASGDDDYTGKASRYDLRYSTSPINDANWDAATPTNGEPNPGSSGSFETMTVSGLDFTTNYYLAIKAMDEFGNPSLLSNIASNTTLGAPTIAVAPGSLSDALLTGGTSVQTLTLENIGAGTLDFQIPVPTLIGGFVTANEYVTVPKGGQDMRPGQPAIEASGGPDAYGYRWTDSNDAFGPAFVWTDISSMGSLAMSTGDDVTSGPFNIGFPFNFYGADHAEFNVCSNGFISLTDNSTDYGNQPLPSAGAPDHLIAPFWDDLEVSGGNVYYYSDGARLIVQWDNVSPYGSPAVHSFQAILYADGSIEYMYNTMGTPLNSATIGLQNGDGSDGLHVVFNSDYVTDNLAVRIKSVPQWMTVTPTAGTVWSAGNVSLDVAFNASGLVGGAYDGIIRIINNDPATPVMEVPVTLDVTGAPQILLAPAAYDFGNLFVGSSLTTTVEVRNIGTDVLNVTGISLGDAAFTADQSAFVLMPGASQPVVVTFAPTMAQNYSTSLTVTSDDPNNPVTTTSLSGLGQDPPSFAVNPASLTSNLFTGNSEDQTLTLTNDGGSDFTFDLAVDFQASVTVHEYQEVGKGDIDTRAGTPVLLGSGGPDIYGYRWVDSDEPGGPAFNWTDVSGTGAQAFTSNSDDSNSGPLTIGFDFPFYGNSFSEFRVSSNGWISFTSSLTAYSNQALPNGGAPENLLAPFWDDLKVNPSSGGNVFYEYDGTKLVIQFDNVVRYAQNTTPISFEVCLYPDGTILYQYLDMQNATLTSATVGMQNDTKDDGLTVAFNTAYVHDGLAVRFQAFPEWMVVSPLSGTIPAGGSLPITTTFNATNMFGGQYDADIVINSNDPAVPTLPVPATLHVTGAPQMLVSQTAFDFGDNFIGTPTLQNLIITNAGTDDLVISGAVIVNGDFNTSLAPPVTIGATSTRVVTVGYLASAEGASTGTLTISSNDPTTPELEITLAGAGLYPPAASVDPTSLFADLFTGETEDQMLTVSNTGSSDLNFTASAMMVATEVQIHAEVILGKDDIDTNVGTPVTQGSGGPDLFGYRWIDSDEPGGPVFDWVDISTTGTQAFTSVSDDRNSGLLPIGFTFPFYGNTFDEFRISSNGWISFTSSLTAYSNQNLPNSGAPENLLALFWDDLKVDPSNGGNVFYEYDGNKLIVQFDNVARFYSGGPYTCQAFLYPNGTIIYQYLDMQGSRLDEATIGLQNATKDDGMAIAYNTDYIHDGLAIRIQSLNDWLVVSPAAGTIPAGGSMPLNVRFNANEMFGGDYEGAVQVVSNDPVNGLIEVPTTMHVTGVPVLEVDPVNLDFSDVFIGYDGQMTMMVTNTGTDQLLVSDITSNHGDFTVTPTVFELDPYAGQLVTATFAPTTAGVITGNLSLVSNDANSPATVVMTGNGVVPPVTAVDPASIVGAAMPGGNKTKTLQVCNTGGSDLVFSLTAGDADLTATQVYDYVAIGKDEEDTRPGILGSGGPDDFGHTWTDSDEPDGPAFDWVDISTTGTPVFTTTSDDRNSGLLPIGFDFPFYGESFPEFRVCSNGWVSFTSSSTTYSNQALPNSGAPENLLAPCWDDLRVVPGDGNNVYYEYDGTKLTIQYDAVYRYYSNGPYTFQAILYPNGDIIYQYLDMQGSRLDEATIGIQNGTKDDGMMMAFNTDYIHDGLAILISQESAWLSASPESGIIPAGECMDITVTMDAATLAAGDYNGVVNLSSNDPATPTVDVPVLFHVGTIMAAAADMDPNTLNLDSNGKWITGMVELPAGYDPADVVLETVLLNGEVAASAQAFSWTEDFNNNGITDLQFKFDRLALEAILPEGEDVIVTMTGEIRDTIYFVATDTIRVIRPRMTSPNGGEALLVSSTIDLSWENPSTWNIDHADLYYTIDGGENWVEIASDVNTTNYTWTPPVVETQSAYVRVFIYDNKGMIGFDSSDEPFTLTGTATPVLQTTPLAYDLDQNHPNPFNPRTTIKFALLKGGYTALKIYDVRGREVRTLVSENLDVGSHQAVWSGNDNHGQRVSSGMYFYRIESGTFTETRSMILLK